MSDRPLIQDLREAPQLSTRFVAVWLRNLRVWRKLMLPSILGNFGEPLLYLLALGYGLGRLAPHAEHDKALAPLADAGLRVEPVGETVLIYGQQRDRLLDEVEALVGPGYLYRPASLEDVFLRLTGRELRD